MSPEEQHIIKNGIFYTPEDMANILAAEAFKGFSGRITKVLDPSCGNGALLRASSIVADSVYPSITNTAIDFIGCDLFKPCSWPDDNRIKLYRGDFFDLPTTDLFDIIVMNPPYVQYGRLEEKKREKYYRSLAQKDGLWKNVDLWTYFLLKSLRHLNMGGTIAAVVPWSLIEAQYAHDVRKLLANNFLSIRVLVLRDRHFDSTEKRVLLMWLKGYGNPSKKIQMAFSGTIGDSHEYSDVSTKEWNSSNILSSHGLKSKELLLDIQNMGFATLNEYADVSIGVVTGDNKYFIVPTEKSISLGFSEASTVPILTHVQELNELVYSSSPENVLIQFPRTTERRNKYIQKGIRKKVHKRSHCQRRTDAGNQWYNVDTGATPDAFFTYRVSKIPFMVLNPKKYQCTNTLHKVFFKSGVQSAMKQWIQLSLLSDAGQLSLEVGARHYGNSVLKVEPGILKNAMVFASDKPVPSCIYSAVCKAFNVGNKEEASRLATEAIKSICSGKEFIWADITEDLKNVRLRRNGIREKK